MRMLRADIALTSLADVLSHFSSASCSVHVTMHLRYTVPHARC